MRFMRRLPVLLLAAILVVAGCGSQEPVATDDSVPVTSIGTSSSISTTSENVATSPETSTTTTQPRSSTSTTQPPTTVREGLRVIADVDRQVELTAVILADDDGTVLGTVFDPNSQGCEGVPADYFATVGPDGIIRPTSIGDDVFQYTGGVSASTNQRQLLEVSSCEGFLGGVTVYDVGPSLQLVNSVEIDTEDALAGDATWNADGFITMVLIDQPGYGTEPGDDEAEPEVTIEEYLVNPRTGESTLFGLLENFSYGAIRTPDGTQIYSEPGADPYVALVPRGSSDERQFSANDFALSPDATQLAIWDSVFDVGDDGEIQLLDMDTGFTTTIAEGRSLRLVWRDDSSRLAFSAGAEAFVHDLGTGETVSLGAAEPLNCTEQDYVTWGRIPLAFAPDGDLYVGDPVCVISSRGFPAVEYGLRQLSFS